MRKPKESPEIWAVLSEDFKVQWTPGGSSTSPKLMVYPDRKAAERGIKWARNPNQCFIHKIYNISEVWGK